MLEELEKILLEYPEKGKIYKPENFEKDFPFTPKVGYVSTGRPRGWAFMNEYVDKDGNVFHKGKEQPKLKGTLPPTEVKPRKKPTKNRRTKEQILLDRHKEKKEALKKAVQKQKDFLNHKIEKE